MTDEALEDVHPGRLVPGVDNVVQRCGRAFMTSAGLAECEQELGLPRHALYVRGRSAVFGPCGVTIPEAVVIDPRRRGRDTLLRIAWRPDDADDVVARARDLAERRQRAHRATGRRVAGRA